MQGTLFIVSGPSGAGKATLVQALLQHNSLLFPRKRVVTYTSRLPREGEISGIDYHFVSNEAFEQLMAIDFFFNWSAAYGAYYGTSRCFESSLDRGAAVFLIVDRLGIEPTMRCYPQAVSIFIYNTLDCLAGRLRARGTDESRGISRRLELAKEELSQEMAAPLCRYHLINEDFNEAVSHFEKIVAYEIEKRCLKSVEKSVEKLPICSMSKTASDASFQQLD